jgi:Yip1-like protein
MSESSAAAAATGAPPQPSFWEDVIDIFFQPAAVFRRRQNRSVWPPMLFVAIAVGVIFFVTFNTLQPMFDAEFMRNAAHDPRMTPQVIDKARAFSTTVPRYIIGIGMLITMVILGTVIWIVAKFVSSELTFQGALVVAAWSYMPRVIGAVLAGVQGLLMDPSKLTSQLAISLSPARFLDPDASNPFLYQILGRFDLITIWITILIGVGVYIIGKTSKGSATTVAILVWILGAIPYLRTAILAM